MRLAYILPISPIPIIPTVILFSESIGVVIAGTVEQDMMIENQLLSRRLQIEVCDVRCRWTMWW